MPPDDNQTYDLHLVRAVQGLSSLRQDLLQDVFLSYCTKDLPHNGSEESLDPEQIRRDLIEAGFSW